VNGRAAAVGRPLVLVHGAWHGAWCWDRVAEPLTSAGLEVHVPTLTGLGDRADELDREVGLQAHVDDVLAELDALDRPGVLVGHSYAGVVVREVADQRPDAVAHLVLVDGWVPADGQSLFDIAPDWFVDALTSSAETGGEGWRFPVPDPAWVGVRDPDDVALLHERLTEHPVRTFTDPTRLSGAVDEIPTTAIVADPSSLPFRTWAEDAGWPVHAVRGGHDLMLTATAELVTLLHAAATD
jgi:pimeloyl-ACP methyl ester carboxylesterase